MWKELQQKFDKENLSEVIESLPNQFSQAFDEVAIKISEKTEKIFICGMGGSALPANLLKTYLNCVPNFNIQIEIVRDYTLPKYIDEKWAGFFMSYSGNTEETLSALDHAESKGIKNITIMAHGGKLKSIAQGKGYNVVKIPDTKQPRMSYGYTVGSFLKIFNNSGLTEIDLTELSDNASKAQDQNDVIQKEAQALAERIKGKIPIIYSSNKWRYVSMVWKINFNENSKTQSFWNAIPEMNHNELVGYTNILADYYIIAINDPDSLESIQKRMTTLKEVLKDKTEVEIIQMQNGSVFYKMITSLLLGLWTSYYLALLNKVDPTPVDMVENFKKLLTK